MESHLRVEIVPRPDGTGQLARINGAEFPVIDIPVQTEGGLVMSLVLAPDSIQIGDPSTGGPSPEVRPAVPQTTYGDMPGTISGAKVSSWGGSIHPDPRESIPGWQPETLSSQVAGHAERVALSTTTAASPVWLDRNLGGQGGNTAVTA